MWTALAAAILNFLSALLQAFRFKGRAENAELAQQRAEKRLDGIAAAQKARQQAERQEAEGAKAGSTKAGGIDEKDPFLRD